jgi:hypothetical protein
MARTDYDPLRAAHQAALDAANSPSQPAQDISAPEPTRPKGHYAQQSPGWTSAGGMEQQQASAAQWAKVSQQRQEAARGHDAGGQFADEKAQPEQTQGAARTLKFFEDQDRSGEKSDKELERQGAERSPTKEQGASRTLTFFEDRKNDQDRSR